jgi:hypothetical protein
MSLWLLDPSARPDAQAAMAAAEHALIGTDLADRAQVQALTAGLQRAAQLEQAGTPGAAIDATPHPGGLLGDELGNITFGVPERQAATDSVALLTDAAALVRSVQAQDQPGQHFYATVRWLSAGSSAFTRLQGALDRTIAVNQAEFDRRVTASLGTTGLIPPVTAAALALSALLAVGGVWLRLREYR